MVKLPSFLGAALHGLRGPVGVGQLVERIRVAELHQRDGVYNQWHVGDIGHRNAADFRLRAARHKDQRLRAQAGNLRENARVIQPDAALIPVQRLQARHEERREQAVALRCVQAQVKRPRP
jgi:hypothetical protein